MNRVQKSIVLFSVLLRFLCDEQKYHWVGREGSCSPKWTDLGVRLAKDEQKKLLQLLLHSWGKAYLR